MKAWKFYNKCWMPTCADKETPDLEPIKSGEIWKEGGLFARWEDDFDCGYETPWYHVIKDKPFDISSLKSKRRWIIKKGRESFEVRRIDGRKYVNEIFEVLTQAYLGYPKKYRPTVTLEDVEKGENRRTGILYGAFLRESGKLCGIAGLHLQGNCYGFSSQKTIPEYERLKVDAALVDGVLEDLKEDLSNGFYIDDGARNLLHETDVQAFDQKYFGFRPAYCILNVAYNPKIRWAVRILFPFRRLFKGWNVRVLDLVYATLKMEEIARECKKLKNAHLSVPC